MRSKQQSSTPQPTLLFIPDISGFTKFIHSTEVSHSQHIIEELLEVLIDANEMDLQISEIEGDAILFYRTGKAPSAAEIIAQVEKMYISFHAHLKKYETQRICQCGACANVNGLALKFIIHYGDISRKQVKSFSKLFGKDLVVAHRLMKNEIVPDEYVLITHQLLNACFSWVEMKQIAWEDPSEGEEHYDFGTVKYCYLSMEPLSAHIPSPTLEDFALSNTSKSLEVEAVIKAPMEMVFDIASDTRAKQLWMVGVTGTDQLNSKITQNGSAHRCILNEDGSGLYFISHDFDLSRDIITWTDTNPIDKFSLVFTFRRIGSHLTRVTLTKLSKHNFLKRLLYGFYQKKGEIQFFSSSFEKLDDYCQDKLREGTGHTSNILLEPSDTEVMA